MTDYEKVIMIIKSFDTCKIGLVCKDCPLRRECYESDKTTGELALEYLLKQGKSKQIEIVNSDGSTLLCASIRDAAVKSGYSTTTVSQFARSGEKTKDGISFRRIR